MLAELMYNKRNEEGRTVYERIFQKREARLKERGLEIQ